MTLKRLWIFCAVIAVALLALFGLATALDLPVLSDPTPLLETHTHGYAAAASIALLVVDVLLPVPSSFIMIGNGALFGIGLGATISTIGSVGAAWVGYLLGICGARRLLRRLLTDEESERAHDLLERYGGAAVIVTRPVPIIAETVAIVAGSTRMSALQFTIAALLGSIPASVIYAVAGAHSSSSSHPALVFGVPVVVGSAYWLVAAIVRRNTSTRSRGSGGPGPNRP